MPPPIAQLSPGASLCPSGNQGATVTCRSLESRNGSTGLSQSVRGSQPRGDNVASGTNTPVIHKQRRCGSMKRMLFLGALVLSVTVCSQSFGFELLDRMLGHKGCASCCEPGCDAGAGNGCCEPACDAGSCCGTSCRKKCTPIRDLLKAVHAAKKARRSSCCGTSCCEPGCDAGNGCCEPACDAGAEPACAAAPDCSASISTPVTVAQVSRTVVAK